MAFNLKEYILYRTEIKRELFNAEVDENFKAVANPWVATRVYEPGHIVYHPVEVIPATGATTQALAWFRAKKRTTQGIFELTEWDMVGGVGTGDLTIQGSNSFGKVTVNYTGATGTFQAGNDFTLSSSVPNDTLRLVAGQGASLQYDSTTNTVKILNTNSTGEINNGVNIGTGTHEDVYAGLSGTNLKFKGFKSGNSIISVTTDTVTNNIQHTVIQGNIGLENLNSGSPTANLLSDVFYTASTPGNGDLLQWDNSSGYWKNVPLASVSGAQGAQGTIGSNGVQGIQGVQGFTGSQGTIGTQGITGIQGANGTQGTQGTLGTQGITGIGLQGVQGVPGNQGTQGPTGGSGISGSQGVQGIQGVQGVQGIQGLEGNFGGATFDYAFNTSTATADPTFGYVALNSTTQNAATAVYINDFGVTGADISSFLATLNAGSPSTILGHIRITNKQDSTQFLLFQITAATDNTGQGWWQLDVTNVGSSATSPFTLNEDVLCSFVVTGRKGDTGVQGTIGTQGIQGLQGIQGIQGVQGRQGTQGTIGTQGVQGVQGKGGSQGIQGVQGTIGAQGIQGVQGTQGVKGTQGSIGTQGIQGIGAQGTIGSQGIQGLSNAGTSDSKFGFIGQRYLRFFKGLPLASSELVQFAGNQFNAAFMIDWGAAVANTTTGQNTFNWVTTTDAHYHKMDLPYASMFSNFAGSSVYSVGSTFSMRFSIAVHDVGSAGAGKIRVFPMIWKGSNFTTGAGEIPRADLTKLGNSAVAGQIYEELPLSLATPTTGTIDVLYLSGGATWTTTTEIDPAEDKLLIGFAGDGADAVTNTSGVGTISWKAFIS